MKQDLYLLDSLFIFEILPDFCRLKISLIINFPIIISEDLLHEGFGKTNVILNGVDKVEIRIYLAPLFLGVIIRQ